MSWGKRALSVHFGAELLGLIQAEATRTDRKFSWVVRKMCEFGLDQFRRTYPSIDKPMEKR